jgi:hypothetical protein
MQQQLKISKALWSVESPKAVKAMEYNAVNGILYMAPYTLGGAFNLCANASPACIAACLGVHSGQAAMVRGADNPHAENNVRRSRKLKAQQFMLRRKMFMQTLAVQLAANYGRAYNIGKAFVARPNGSTDIAFESVKVEVDATLARKLTKLTNRKIVPGTYKSLMQLFPFMMFNDYTKSFKRMCNYLAGKLPVNYRLTFSRSETNEEDAVRVLQLGGNVAVVFDVLPTTWEGFEVINGDDHDLRFFDRDNVVIGLLPKGNKAKKDVSGFVVRSR